MKLTNLLALVALLTLSSCESTGAFANAGFIYTGEAICITGMDGMATEACYNHKKRLAYVRYADGRVENLKPVGGGIVGGRLVIQLVDGGRFSIGRDGSVIIEPALPNPNLSAK